MATETAILEIQKPELNNTTNISIMADGFDEFEKRIADIATINVAAGHVTLDRDDYICGIQKATGAPGAARNVLFPDGLTGEYLCVNATTGGQTITFKTVSGTGVDVPAASGVKVYLDGTNVVPVSIAPSSLPTGIPAANIADGSVDNTEFQLLGTATSGNTPGTIPLRDASGRLRVSDPSHANDAASKNYVDLLVAGVLSFQNDLDASSNPNYPAASKGHAYIVTVSGKVGGASGKSVDVGDLVVAKASNGGGTEASVGTSWFVVEHNLVGALLSANNLSDLNNTATARTNLGVQIGLHVQAWSAVLDSWSLKSAPSGDVVGTTDPQTLSNKRITRRRGTTTSSATPTINTDDYDRYNITALAENITSFTTNLSGTPNIDDLLWITITASGGPWTIAYGASFEDSTVTAPTSVASGGTVDVGFRWTGSKWRCVAKA